MKKLTPIRVAILITALLALGAFIAYSAGYRPNAPAPPERIYDAPPEEAMRVLFIGNSHTYVHDVPGMLQRLGEANGTPIWVESLTIGGASLSDHLRKPATTATIQSDAWDFVVLQEHSLTPALNPQQFYRSLDALASAATAAGATPVLYATWARHSDDPYFQKQTQFNSPTHLQKALDQAFAAGAQQSGALVAPVGTAWHHYYGQNTLKRLHAPDGNHANLAGAYLAACVFYRVLQDAPCTGNTYRPGRISEAAAHRLQRVADRSPEQWALQWSEAAAGAR